MKKTSKFESLNDAKFKTLEPKELESVSGGLEEEISMDTTTVYPDNTSKNDGQDAGG